MIYLINVSNDLTGGICIMSDNEKCKCSIGILMKQLEDFSMEYAKALVDSFIGFGEVDLWIEVI